MHKNLLKVLLLSSVLTVFGGTFTAWGASKWGPMLVPDRHNQVDIIQTQVRKYGNGDIKLVDGDHTYLATYTAEKGTWSVTPEGTGLGIVTSNNGKNLLGPTQLAVNNSLNKGTIAGGSTVVSNQGQPISWMKTASTEIAQAAPTASDGTTATPPAGTTASGGTTATSPAGTTTSGGTTATPPAGTTTSGANVAKTGADAGKTASRAIMPAPDSENNFPTITTLKDGTVEAVYPDGTRVISNPDGSMITENAIGGREVRYVDGETKLSGSSPETVTTGDTGEVQGAESAPKVESAAANAKPPETSSLLAPIAIFNVPQYALLIMEALEGNKQDDATKEVTVKGAEPMQDSQGVQGTVATPATSNVAMSASTIGGASEALSDLLKMGKIDLGLLSTDIKKVEKQAAKGVVIASAGSSGADVSASAQASSTPAEETLTSDDQREIRHRRALLLGEWATAATQIGEGSNAISNSFYDRAAAFAEAANAAQGSLGGITAIADTDRFVLFEITRGAALSAVQLGLQGAINLNDLEEVETPSASSAGGSAKAGINAGAAKSQ